MRGVILTGPTGVGKSTAQAILQQRHGFWTPRTLTTRAIEQAESGMSHLAESEFLRGVRAGEVVLPTSFGSEWYGWLRADLAALQQREGRAVLNVRPYAALMLEGLLGGFIAVWLTLDPAELARRRDGRHAARDTDHVFATFRQTQDAEDTVYQTCFAHVLIADDSLITKLVDLSS